MWLVSQARVVEQLPHRTSIGLDGHREHHHVVTVEGDLPVVVIPDQRPGNARIVRLAHTGPHLGLARTDAALQDPFRSKHNPLGRRVGAVTSMDHTAKVTTLVNGVGMRVSDTAIELLVPRLFADRRITLRTDATAVCRPAEMVEPEWTERTRRPPPLEIADLGWPTDRPSLLLASAQPLLCPRVRPRAPVTSLGLV